MKKRKTIRKIEEYSNETDAINNEYLMDISTEELLKILDYKLHDHDHPDHVGEPYILNQEQINQLRPYLKEPLTEDLEKYEYYTSAYDGGNEDGTPDEPTQKMDPAEWKKLKVDERYLDEYDAKTDKLHKSFPLDINSSELLKIINYKITSFDHKDLVFDLYDLDEEQVEKIKSFLVEPFKTEFKADFKKYTYEVNSILEYADGYTPSDEEIRRKER